MKTRKTAAIILLAVMATMACNGTFFLHAHQMGSGKLVTHSHPYFSDSDSPVDPGHSHSEQELEILKFLGGPAYISHNYTVEITPVWSLFSIPDQAEATQNLPTTLLLRIVGRAPPFPSYF